jgi:hypothetical protein
MRLYEYLLQLREHMPPWLAGFTNGDAFRREQFFGSRLVYYPGSGTDGHPVKLFGSTHSAHCFVYADYGKPKFAVEAELEHPMHRFQGYHTLSRLPLAANDLTPGGWAPNFGGLEADRCFADVAPFAFVELLERDQDRDEGHGARRLAILFLGADGIAAYDALFCQQNGPSRPFAILLQDHGFGGNYGPFGRGGLLEGIARRCHAVPQWLLVAENTQPWEGFERVPEVDGDPGGMHNTLRFLYQQAQ